MTVGPNIYLGHVDQLMVLGAAFFPTDGGEVREQANYEVLLVSPNCSLAWMPCTTGDTLPAKALKLGHLMGVGPTYSNRPISRYYSHMVAVRGRCSISHVHAGTLGFTISGFTYMEIHTVKYIFSS